MGKSNKSRGGEGAGSLPDGKASSSPFNNPFGKLQGLREALPQAPAPVAAPPPAQAPPPRGPARAVVRMERKGHGGKEVTRVEQLGLGASELERWLKILKGSLGCGGVVDGDTLQLQGDQRERLPALLQKQGVRKVTVG